MVHIVCINCHSGSLCSKGASLVQIISKNTRILYNPLLLREDPTFCFDIDLWWEKDAVVGSAEGRGTTWFVQTSTLTAALRHYRRGGLLGKLIFDSYFFTGWEKVRSTQEFNLLHYLRSKGIPVPRPLASRTIREGMIYRADLLVEKIENARNLVDVLLTTSLCAEKYRLIGILVRRLHDANVCHSDLNIHNILLDVTGKFWLIDFDKCGCRDGENWKISNLIRLLRSFRKELSKRQIKWQESDWQTLIQGYYLPN